MPAAIPLIVGGVAAAAAPSGFVIGALTYATAIGALAATATSVAIGNFSKPPAP